MIYFHTTGYETAFGTGDAGVLAGDEHARKILERHADLIAPADFILGALWGDGRYKIAELHGYNELVGWSSNPTQMRPWVFRELAYEPDAPAIGFGEMTIAFGREEEFRRFGCKNAYEFMKKRPELPRGLWQPGFFKR